MFGGQFSFSDGIMSLWEIWCQWWDYIFEAHLMSVVRVYISGRFGVNGGIIPSFFFTHVVLVVGLCSLQHNLCQWWDYIFFTPCGVSGRIVFFATHLVSVVGLCSSQYI